MKDNPQSKKWLAVINNPQNDYPHSKIKELAMMFMPAYFCLADEIASTGTYHTHLFIYSNSPIRFNTLKNRLPTAHIEKAFGSVMDNRNYILKADKWAGTEKSETKVEGTFEEWGEIPLEKADMSSELGQVIEDIKSGKEICQVVQERPRFALKVKDLEVLRQSLLMEESKSKLRFLETTYMYGKTQVGKTKSIFEENNPTDIFRITNYKNQSALFDGYSANKILVFEEFHSQIPIEEMLNYLDIYPINLPARYSNKVACYEKVIITSNVSIDQQYIDIQNKYPEIWEAFLRRINNIVEMLDGGIKKYHKLNNLSTGGLII